MYGFTGEAIDIEDIRRRFRAMSDRDLLLTGEAAARLAADKGNPNSPPRDTWKSSSRRPAPIGAAGTQRHSF